MKVRPRQLTSVPDVRTLGLGECLRRAIIVDRKQAFAAHLWPQQVDVGVPSRLSI